MKTLLFIFFFLIVLNLFGQEKEKPINHLKNEIALDFQNAFENLVNGLTIDDNNSSNAIATSLIYRRRIGEKKFVSVNEKKALRFQIGGSFDLPLGSEEIVDNSITGTNNLLEINDKYVNSFIYIGMEWQRQFGKWQLYYGMDTGINYYLNKDVFNIATASGSGQVIFYRERNNRSTRIPLIGFGGLKYYLHPRFSLSYEMSFRVAVGFINNMQQRFEPDIEEPVETEFHYKRKEVSGNMDYLRYFNVSYYF